MKLAVFDATIVEPSRLPPDARERLELALSLREPRGLRVEDDDEGRMHISFRLDVLDEGDAYVEGTRLLGMALGNFTRTRWSVGITAPRPDASRRGRMIVRLPAARATRPTGRHGAGEVDGRSERGDGLRG